MAMRVIEGTSNNVFLCDLGSWRRRPEIQLGDRARAREAPLFLFQGREAQRLETLDAGMAQVVQPRRVVLLPLRFQLRESALVCGNARHLLRDLLVALFFEL